MSKEGARQNTKRRRRRTNKRVKMIYTITPRINFTSLRNEGRKWSFKTRHLFKEEEFMFFKFKEKNNMSETS
jgi:hypothetical protein